MTGPDSSAKVAKRVRGGGDSVRVESAARSYGELVFESEAMRNVVKVLRRAAASDANILLTGETGTGKTGAARAVHLSSRRCNGPFVTVDCAALPDSLFESEVFGHEKGAFTGALASRPGRFEAASDGTILLDEVGDSPLLVQSKLLRFAQTREFERVGSNQTRTVNARIIGATHRDLARLVQDGRFREDLFYRLNVLEIRLPPLRERRADIPLIAARFCEKYAVRNNTARVFLSDAAIALLAAHEWPGNVRELENVLERALVLLSPNSERLEESDVAPGLLQCPRSTAAEVILEPKADAAPPAAKPRRGRRPKHDRKRIAALHGEGLIPARIAKETGIPPTSVLRILTELGLRGAPASSPG